MAKETIPRRERWRLSSRLTVELWAQQM